MKKPHVLFVVEKWRDAHPGSPLTNCFHNLFGSLESTSLATYQCLHYDEYYHAHKKPCDTELIKVVSEAKPDITVFCFIPWFPHLPAGGTLDYIKNKTKCVFIWPDAVWPHHMAMADNFLQFAALSILWDVDIPWRPGTKYLHLWTPQDPRIYHDPGYDRTISVSFVGNSRYPERQNALNFLKSKGVPIHIEGGDSAAVPVERYADLLKRSKIALNFCMNNDGKEQLKGRIFEAINCGAMLMESKHVINWIERWLVPDVHYVSFANQQELLDKINYYLNNDAERQSIARCGWQKIQDCYSSTAWWSYVFSECGIKI